MMGVITYFNFSKTDIWKPELGIERVTCFWHGQIKDLRGWFLHPNSSVSSSCGHCNYTMFSWISHVIWRLIRPHSLEAGPHSSFHLLLFSVSGGSGCVWGPIEWGDNALSNNDRTLASLSVASRNLTFVYFILWDMIFKVNIFLKRILSVYIVTVFEVHLYKGTS